MLATIREYGLEQLAVDSDSMVVQPAHAAFYLDLAERAEPELRASEQITWLNRLEAEQGNLRAALAYLLQSGEDEMALRLAGALLMFWFMRGHLTEGNDWLTRVLSRRSSVPAAVQTKALCAASMLAWAVGEYQRAAALAEEALTTAQAANDALGSALALYHLGTVAELQGHDDQAAPLYEQSLAQFRDLGDEWGIVAAAMVVADTAYREGEYARAVSLAQEALATYRTRGDRFGAAITVGILGEVALAQGELIAAATAYGEALDHAEAVGEWWIVADALSGFAGIAVSHGQAEQAARLLGTVDALCTAAGRPLVPHHLQQKRALADTRAALDAPTFAAAWAEGRARPPAQAIAEARALVADPAGTDEIGGRTRASPACLTPREQEVLRLLVAGHTNREIAAALFITHRTAMTHVTNILAKLDVASRTEAAAWAVRHGLA
jgi:non-specific serine/threonine protein kinase